MRAEHRASAEIDKSRSGLMDEDLSHTFQMALLKNLS